MPDEPAGTASAGEPSQQESRVPAGPQTSPPARPPRSNTTPAPIDKPILPTGAIKISHALWLLSFLAGVIAIVFAFLSRNTQVKEHSEFISELDSKQDTDTADTVTAVVFWATISAVAVVSLIEYLLVRRMMGRHEAVRWALLLMLVVHTAVTLLGDAFIAFGGEGIYNGRDQARRARPRPPSTTPGLRGGDAASRRRLPRPEAGVRRYPRAPAVKIPSMAGRPPG